MSDTDITPDTTADPADVPEASTDPVEASEVAEADAPEVAEPDAPEVEAADPIEAPDEIAEPDPVEAAVEPEPEAAPDPEATAEPAAETPAPVAVADDDVVDVEGLVYEHDDAEPEAKPESPFDRPGRWYVVHTQSGHEKKAQQNLAARTASMNMEERIYESVIPMEDVVEFRNGKKVVVQKKMFPGYLLVRSELDDDAWYVIRNTPSVVNFVGSAGKPSPLLRAEVETFLQIKEEGAPSSPAKRSKARLEYEMGETVRVKEGPFADFSGEIVEINEDQLKVKVLVNIFGRETPVELEFSQVARL